MALRMDMHVHSAHSGDSRMPVEEILESARRAGLHGIAITDHNEIAGALEAKRKSKDLIIIVGEEIKTLQGEILAYNIKRRIEPFMTMEETIEAVRKQGGLIAVSHPFDMFRSDAVRNPEVLERIAKNLDFVEINGRSLPESNRKAKEFARRHGIPLIAGSDAHTPMEIGTAYTIFHGKPLCRKTDISVSASTLELLGRLFRTKLYKTLGI